MTETCSHQYTLPNDDPRLIVESCGRSCPGYEIRIFDRDNPNRELKAGEIGQIGGRGASLMLGYFDDQKSTEEAFNRDGWFMTGDLGWIDEAGYLRITGRKKDVIIRGGHNIYPAKIKLLAATTRCHPTGCCRSSAGQAARRACLPGGHGAARPVARSAGDPEASRSGRLVEIRHARVLSAR